MNTFQSNGQFESNMNFSRGPVRTGRSWVTIGVGLAFGLVAMHVFVTRPMMKQMNHLQEQVTTLTHDLELIGGLRDQWTAAADVVSAAAESKRQINEAWKSLAAIDEFREGVETELGRFNQLNATLAQVRSIHDEIATLQSSLIQQGASILAIKRTVAQFEQARKDLTEEINLLRTARHQLAEFDQFADEIARQRWGIEQGRQALENLLIIKNDIVRSSHDIEFARRRTDTMLDMITRLRGDDVKVGTALDNLIRLEQIRDRLSTSGEQINGAVQSLDLIEGFQRGITLDSDRLASLTQSIHQIATLATSSEDLLKLLMPFAKQKEGGQNQEAEIQSSIKEILKQQREDAIPSTLEPVSDKRIE
ncbi:hypothetical protein K2Y11_18655 [bacterium]|nr:hypothetical protein [bacterium]